MAKIKFEDKFSINDLGDYVLQGLWEVGDYLFISAYDSSDKRNNSIIYIIDKNYKVIKKTTLDNNSHVGGICYDKDHGVFWITDKKGTISSYTYDDVFNKDEVSPKYKKIDVGSCDLLNYKNSPSVAYICYFDKRLFLGNYSKNGKGLLKEFKIKYNGSIDLLSEKKSLFFDGVQGLYLYEKDNDIYMLVSISFGRYKKSILRVLKYQENIKSYLEVSYKDIDMPPMMEQIIVNKNNKLMTLYESNGKKYKTLFNRNKDVCIVDINKII